MKSNRTRDIVLIAAVVAVAVAALWPAKSPQKEDEAGEEKGAKAERVTSPSSGDAARKRVEAPAPVVAAKGSAFPLVAGARWVYHVEGPKDLVPDSEWTMEVRSVPVGSEPGEIALGFGVERQLFPIWDDEGRIRFAGLPFTAPLEFTGTRATSVEGVFLPAGRGLVEGAAWSQTLNRDVSHEMMSPKGSAEKIAARGVETDRAIAGELADVIVPAGKFPARRVDWTCRLELLRGKRTILDPLTAKAFRTEIMWVAEGVGIVRRRVEHVFPSEVVIVFDLMSTTLSTPRDGK
jgi:hypothetical protein